MKTFTILFILLTGLTGSDFKTMKEEDYSWVLEEMETVVMPELGLDEQKIRIFDQNGNAVGEYSYEKFIENELELSEVQSVMDSEFLFDYAGDSYYLKS